MTTLPGKTHLQLIVVLALLSIAAVTTTELRVCRLISPETSNSVIYPIALVHLAIAALYLWLWRSPWMLAYLAATVVGFLLVDGITPSSAAWSVLRVIL